MLLTAFILTQLAVDVILAILGVACLWRLRWRPRARPAAPEWQPELMLLARELVTVTESAIEALGRRPADVETTPVVEAVAPAEPASAPTLRLVHSAAAPVPRRGEGLLPGEMRLAENVAAARAAAEHVED